MDRFPKVFSDRLRRCTKTKVKFEVKENAKPILLPKRNLLFATLEPINKELEQLEKFSVLSKVKYSN